MQAKTWILAILIFVLAWNYLMPTVSVTKNRFSVPSLPTEKEEKTVPLISPVTNDIDFHTLEIPSISLFQTFPDNQTVEKGITILENSTHLTILAAHSGSGPMAIFTPIELLQIGDEIVWNQESYLISDVYYTLKDGDIDLSLSNQFQYLVLTTCSQRQKGKQLVIIAKK